MKKLIFMAVIALAVVVSQPVKAQVSVNINIGAQPYYTPSYYGYNYYVPTRAYPQRTYVVHRPVYVPVRTSRYYVKPSHQYYAIKKYHPGKGHYKGKGRGRH